jgi:hypothetical protein
MHIFACEEWIEFQKRNFKVKDLKVQHQIASNFAKQLVIALIDIWHFISYMPIPSYLQIS